MRCGDGGGARSGAIPREPGIARCSPTGDDEDV